MHSSFLALFVALAAAGCGRIGFQPADPCDLPPGASAPYAGGSGTAQAPYAICAPAQLVALASRPQDVAAHFILLRDLDFGGVAFSGLGTKDAPFRGVIDGNGKTIANLAMTGVDAPVGFFNASQDARLANVTFDQASIAGSGSASEVGLISGNCTGTQVRDLTATNLHVQGESNVGGVFGDEYGCQVIGATLSGMANASVGAVGGVVGAAEQGVYLDIDSTISVDAAPATGVGGAVGVEGDSPLVLQNVHVQATVVGHANVGGLLGENGDGTLIYRSTFDGSVRGIQGVGGIVGVNYDVPFYIYSTSVRADITGTTEVGGFAGEMGEGARYSDCSVTATITGTGAGQASFGGFAGAVTYPGRIDRSYAHVTIDSQAATAGGFFGELQYWSANTANYDVASSFVAADVTGSSSTDTISRYVGSDLDPNPLVGAGSYYWSGGACINNGGGGCGSGGTGVADEAQFQDPTQAPLSSWDFVDVWQQQTGAFPSLRTEQPRAPTVTGSCPATAIVGLRYQCSLAVTDGDKNEARVVVFAPDDSCGWARSVTQPEGSIYGTPASDDVGSCTLAFVVTDGVHDTAVQSFPIEVQNGVSIDPADGGRPSHVFAPVPLGSTGTVSFTLTNREPVAATQVAITGLPAGGFQLAGGTCTDTLTPGASCTVSISFSPTVAGQDTEVIEVRFTAARGPASYAFTLYGDGY